MNKPFNRFDTCFTDLACGKHDLASDDLLLALTNTEPSGRVLADIAEISYRQCSPRVLTSKLERNGGGIRLFIDDMKLTASGVVGPFRYFVVCNGSAADRNLIGWSDFGSSVTLEKDDSITVKFDRSKGVLEIK